ncbi:MAG: TetR/AcrR family transcriptional regulator [Clostridia bacterium]|nr:TetR/AcrR family transcriptional regulator [Clostridia bacterium]
MANRDTSIDPRLIKSAKKHFKKYGFLGAQLSKICSDAGVTTGAVYKRYKGKEELFEAVVSDTVDKMNSILSEARQVDPNTLSDEQLVTVWANTEENTKVWYNRLLEMKEGLGILLNCSDGTKYSRFHDEWLDKMSDIDFAYLKVLQDRGLADTSVTKLELHIMVSAMWQLYTEPVIHEMSDEEVAHHCRVAGRLFNWSDAIGIRTK